MNISENKKLENALELFEMNINEIPSITIDNLRKQYHKLSLKWHPDKNVNNSEESTKKFQQISESYRYLLKILFHETENSNTFNFNTGTTESSNNLYRVLLSGFLRFIINSEYLLNVIQEIILNSNVITSSIFENVDVQTAINLYNLLCKYRDVFHISNEILSGISLLIKEKYKNDKIIILRSLIDDLWQNNIYKLNLHNEYYLVPLWHHELYFEKNSVIVLCNPVLPNDVVIDENNNIIVEVYINIQSELSELMNENYKVVSIGCQNFAIPLNKLNLKKNQTYKFKGQGISKIMEDDIYNTSNKSDVIMHIHLI
jgi:hypothetical protein